MVLGDTSHLYSPFPLLEQRGPPQLWGEKIITKACEARGELGHHAVTTDIMVTQQSWLLTVLVSSAAPAVQRRHSLPAEQELSLHLGHTRIHVWGWYGTIPPRKKKRADVLHPCGSESLQREPVSAPQTLDQMWDPTQCSAHGQHCCPQSSCYCPRHPPASRFILVFHTETFCSFSAVSLTCLE